MKPTVSSIAALAIAWSLLASCAQKPKNPQFDNLDELELGDNEIALAIPATESDPEMQEYVAALIGDYGASGIVMVLDEAIAQRRVEVSGSCPEGQDALFNVDSNDYECSAPTVVSDEDSSESAELFATDDDGSLVDDESGGEEESLEAIEYVEDGSDVSFSLKKKVSVKKAKAKVKVTTKAKAKKKPAKKPGSAVNPDSKLPNKDKQYDKDKFTSYKTFKGKAVTEDRPISYINNSNVLGRKKLYRGVKDLNGISGGNRDKYIDDAFRKGIPSNYRLNANVPGVKNPNEGPKTNVWEHMNKSAENSVFVPTTKKLSVAKTFAKGSSGGVFVIRPKESTVIDVNKTVGKTGNPDFYKQKEYVFANEIRGNEITHFMAIDNKGKVVNKIKNPYISK